MIWSVLAWSGLVSSTTKSSLEYSMLSVVSVGRDFEAKGGILSDIFEKDLVFASGETRISIFNLIRPVGQVADQLHDQ